MRPKKHLDCMRERGGGGAWGLELAPLNTPLRRRHVLETTNMDLEVAALNTPRLHRLTNNNRGRYSTCT
jgi:hypothetical protein